MARHRGPRSAGEQPEAIVEPVADLIDREDFDARGGQLQRQGDPIKPPADLRDSSGVAE